METKTTRTELQEMECRKCKEVKPITFFALDKNLPYGYRRLCKNCMSKDIKEYYDLKKKDGRCVRCGKKVDRKITLCNLCIKKDTIRVIKKRKLNKIRAINYLGGVCKECGLKSNIYWIYDFHHCNKDKEFGLCDEMGHSWEKLKIELDKCELLCANCHRTKHWNLKNGS